MEPKRSWRQQIKIHPVLIAFLAVVVVLTILSILGYIFNWDWVGLGPYVSPPHSTDSDFQRGKTLWDWLQLLIIPIALALIAIWFNRNERKNEQKIASDNQQEAALQAYIDKMSELLFEQKLRESIPEGEVRSIARARTLTVLPRLDSKRKGILLQFLHESNLINKDTHIIDLNGADLSTAILYEADLRRNSLWINDLSESDLSEANLYRANLSNANLSNANLSNANLHQADLSAVDLSNANLDGADLTGATVTDEQLATAKSFKGAIMPDRKMYPNSNGANLHKADLHLVNLSGVDLSGADLTSINLSGVDLTSTNLYDADLSKANLKGATGITAEELEKQAKSLKAATMPDGSIHP